MEYRSEADLAKAVFGWSLELPRSINLIVGVPRSGMLPATLLALHLNLPLTDLDGFISGRTFASGFRNAGSNRQASRASHALIVDDSLSSGRAMEKVRTTVVDGGITSGVSYGVVYSHSYADTALVDHWYENVPQPRVFAWNVMHSDKLSNTCMDIDGVLCRDPGDMENDDGPAYKQFLETVPARYVPGRQVGWLVTNRLERYRPQTETWLASHGIRYGELIMHPAQTGAERLAIGDHASRKADVYRKTKAELFIESSEKQASEIARRARRSVYCTDSRTMFQPTYTGELIERGLQSPAGIRARIIRRLGRA